MATNIVKIETAQINIRIARITFEPPLSKPELRLWKKLGPAPKREFPNFKNLGPELESIKKTLRERAEIESQGALKTRLSTRLEIDLVKSGDNEREKGLLLAPFPIKKLENPAFAATGFSPEPTLMKKLDIQVLTQPEIGNPVRGKSNGDPLESIMKGYFDEATQTEVKWKRRLGNTSGDQEPLGIPHDYNTVTKTHRDVKPGVKPNAWLPGLFLIDEIFKALLSTTDDKVIAVNCAYLRRMSFPGTSPKEYLQAKKTLDTFVEAISQNKPGLDPDADKYLPFINYQKSDTMPTYIKPVYLDEFIIGTIVRVGDWAGGSHSSGSVIHP